MARAQGARAQMLLAYESTYGTPPVSGFKKLPFAGFGLAAKQPLLASELLGLGRDPQAPIKDALTADGDVTIPIDSEGLGYWLKGAFGAPTTTGTGPYVHTFHSGNWSLPSMSIEEGLPDVPFFDMFYGVMVDKLSWQMQRSGLLTAKMGLVAKGHAPAGATAGGSPTTPALKRFGHFNGILKRDGTTLAEVVSAEINYSNNLDRIEVIASSGEIAAADPSIASLDGKLSARFSDMTMYNLAVNGTACELKFQYSLGSGESLVFTAHSVFLPVPGVEVNGPQGVQVSFDWQAAKDSVSGYMATVVLTNNTASY